MLYLVDRKSENLYKLHLKYFVREKVTKRHNRRYKISRRLGVNLWGRDKDPVTTRPTPPGMSSSQGKPSDYGMQLREKQKLKKYYGDIREKQFKGIFKEAARRKGDTGQNLVGLLESRLDAFIYRSCFAPTVFSARQVVNHGHVLVDGKRVNIPSYRLKPGQVVEIRQKSREIPLILEATQSKERSVPEYIEIDNSKMTAKYSRMPELADIPYPVVMEPNMVIEFYSR